MPVKKKTTKNKATKAADKDKAFIAKIKTIGFVMASPSKEDPAICEHCHLPMADHPSGFAISVPHEVAEAMMADMADYLRAVDVSSEDQISLAE